MAKVTKDMGIMDIVTKWPETQEVFKKYGMGCFGCVAAKFENVEQGATAHGVDVAALMVDLNAAVEDKGEGNSCSGCDCGCS